MQSMNSTQNACFTSKVMAAQFFGVRVAKKSALLFDVSVIQEKEKKLEKRCFNGFRAF